jgi:hypothetical protein
MIVGIVVVTLAAALGGCRAPARCRVLEPALRLRMGAWVAAQGREAPIFAGRSDLLRQAATAVRSEAPRFSARQGSFFWRGEGWAVQFVPDRSGLGGDRVQLRRPGDIRLLAVQIVPKEGGVARRLSLYKNRTESLRVGPTRLAPQNFVRQRLSSERELRKIVQAIVEEEAAFWADRVNQLRLAKEVERAPGRPPPPTTDKASDAEGRDNGTFRWRRGAFEATAECALVEATPRRSFLRQMGGVGKQPARVEARETEGATLRNYALAVVSLAVRDERGGIARRLVLRPSERVLVAYGPTLLDQAGADEFPETEEIEKETR